MVNTNFIAAIVLSAVLSHSQSPPGLGCERYEPTSLRQKAREKNCKFIVVGRSEKRIDDPNDADLIIDRVLKHDLCLNGVRVIKIPLHLLKRNGIAGQNYLVFGDIREGEFKAYWSAPASDALLKYFDGLSAIDEKDHSNVLKYVIDHWDDEDECIVEDILIELVQIDWKSLRRDAPSMPSEKLRKRLSDLGAVMDTRLTCAAILLGFQGQESDLPLFRSQMARTPKDFDLIKALLLGAILVSPREGWSDFKNAMETSKPIYFHFAGLRVLEMIYQERVSQITERDWLETMARIVNNKDLSDLAIESLRKIKCWKLTDQILVLKGKSDFDLPLIRRSMLRYCVDCPEAKAKLFVEAARKANPEMVQDLEDLMKAIAATDESR